MNDISLYVALAILIPALVGCICFLLPKRNFVRDGVTILGAISHIFVMSQLYSAVISGAVPKLHVLKIFPGANISFAVEPLGLLFGGLVSILWLISSVYAIGYMRASNEDRLHIFFGFFAIAISATVALAFSDNLIALFVFYEVLTFSTYPLVSHRRDSDARDGARKYITILLSTSVLFFLPAIVWTYGLSGTVEFKVGGIIPSDTSVSTLLILAFLFLYGVGKAAVMPVHRWLPSAMVAPAPVSALLHAVAVVKAGVFTILKIIIFVFGVDSFKSFGGSTYFVYISGITVIVASVIALGHDNLKSRLAYSTISQLSYVVLAASLATPLAIIGACMHIIAHAFLKITLFFAAGSIYLSAHKIKISDLDGIGKRMPFTMLAFAIGALGMIGIPPTAGFLGKWFILSSVMSSQDYFVIFVIFVSTLLNTSYFVPVIYNSFAKSEQKIPTDDHGESPFMVVLPLSITALASLLIFLFPALPLSLIKLVIG
ncbi:MAG: cation:proton antiporter [Rhodospirillaceae bacterium]|nr:cation:proton antiporter [Rhodospirillaceae bacterium]